MGSIPTVGSSTKVNKLEVLDLSSPTYEIIECDDLIKKFEEMTLNGYVFISAQKPKGRMQITLRRKDKGHYVTLKEAS